MSDRNETASPVAPDALALRRATLSQRLLTQVLVLDTIFFYIAAFCLGIVLAIIGVDGDMLESIPNLALGALILLAYYVPQEALGGRTLGKMIMKTQVVSEDGGPVSLGQVLVRTVCRLITLEFVSFFGHAGDGPRGWHDRIAKTVVITTA